MYISEWLVLGPITTKQPSANPTPSAKEIIEDIDASKAPLVFFSHRNNITALLNDAPNQGEGVNYVSRLYSQSAVIWQSLAFQNAWDNIESIKNNIQQLLCQRQRCDYALAFFLVYIYSPEERTTKLWVRSDDSIRIWLNGIERLSLTGGTQSTVLDKEEVCNLILRKGYNVLVAAVGNQTGNWGFSARLEQDADLTLSPEKPASFIYKWLVLGPIFNPSDQSPSSEEAQRPKAGNIINEIDTTLADNKLTQSLQNAPKSGETLLYSSPVLRVDQRYIWHPLGQSVSAAEVADNIQALSAEFQGKNHALAFFLVYLKSLEDNRETKLWARSGDSMRVWLNGEELQTLRYIGDRPLSPTAVSSTTVLKKGYNILLVAVAKTRGDHWGFSVRIENHEGLLFTTEQPVTETTECPQLSVKLGDISSCYSIFEKDQVLTHEQLNSITDYFNEQTRFTRVKLIGVGIVCGLQVKVANSGITIAKGVNDITTESVRFIPSLAGQPTWPATSNNVNAVVVTKGVGITTEGDLLYFDKDMEFDKFRPYDGAKLVYKPFYKEDGEMITIYELVRHEVVASDYPATPLSQFDTQMTDRLNNMVVVLLMECHVDDLDLCSSTGCDNLGKNCVNTIRVLLVKKEDITLLTQPITTPYSFYKELHEIVVGRPVFSSSAERVDIEYLAKEYRHQCTAIHEALIKQFPSFRTVVNALTQLSDSDTVMLSDGLEDRLQNLHNQFTTANRGDIQYYYDFLKDCVETYHRFREYLFGDATWCSPDIQNFPKHLLLGELAKPNENRTGFYPSHIVSQTAEQLDHAKFLAKKLDTLIQTFNLLPSSQSPIRITPSLFENHPLEERAIPYYYQIEEQYAIQQHWNYRWHQEGVAFPNEYYIAVCPSPTASPASASTSFNFQVEQCSFFRIEGHLDKAASEVYCAIKTAIRDNNLPFTVHQIVLDERPFADYPSLGHFAGVIRGGTFVLVCAKDDKNTVVGDFMLPYYWLDSYKELLFKPTLTATQSNDILTAASIEPTFNDNNFTGVNHYGLRVTEGNIAIGRGTTAGNTKEGWYSPAIAMGDSTIASGNTSTAMGYNTKATGEIATAMGDSTEASGNTSTAMGYITRAKGQYSTAMGQDTHAGVENDSDLCCDTAMGQSTIAVGGASTAMGYKTIASGNISTAMGESTEASGKHATAMGYRAKATRDHTFVWSDGNFSGSTPQDFTSTAPNQFLIHAAGGVGINTDKPQSKGIEYALYVNGATYINDPINGHRADYTEYFESLDQTAILVGTSVLLEAGKIRPAKPGEVPFGIISANAMITGGVYTEWPKKYLRDDFGRPLLEKRKVSEQVPQKQKVTKQRQKVVKKIVTETLTRPEIVLKNGKYYRELRTETRSREVEEPVFAEVDLYDPNNEQFLGKHRVPVMETYEEEITVTNAQGQPVLINSGKMLTLEELKLNPAYNVTQEYLPRQQRPEWNCVGLLGQIPLRKGQPVAPHWVKIRDISEEVELWLVK